MLFSPFVKLAMALILTAEWFYNLPVILPQGNGGGGGGVGVSDPTSEEERGLHAVDYRA